MRDNNSTISVLKEEAEEAVIAHQHEMMFKRSTATQNVLQSLGLKSKADSVFLFQCDEEAGHMTQIYEWRADQGQSEKKEETNSYYNEKITFEKVPCLVKHLYEGRMMQLFPEELPTSALQKERDQFCGQGLESVLIWPLWRRLKTMDTKPEDKVLHGFIGLGQATHKRVWTQEEEGALKVAADLLMTITTISETPMDLHFDTKQADYELAQEQIEVIERIIQRFDKIRKKPFDDQWDGIGRAVFVNQMKHYIKHSLPIPFVLPAFPCKSGNDRTKVSGKLPDMGEMLAVETLISFAKDIRAIYPPGAKVVVVSDGRVFADLVDVDDVVVSQYQRLMRRLAPHEDISWIGLEDFFARGVSSDELRERFMGLYGRPIEQIEKKIKEDMDFCKVFRGFRKFMQHDRTYDKSLSRNKKHRLISDIAKNMMRRNEAYNELVQDMFPHHLRLSIHAHSNVKKFGVNLVGSDSYVGTPWHNVAVLTSPGTSSTSSPVDANGWMLIKKEDAEKLGYRRVERELSGVHVDDSSVLRLVYYVQEE